MIARLVFMWVAEFRMWHVSPTLEITKKYSVKIYVYYLGWFVERGRQYVIKAAFVEGREAAAAVKEMTADPRFKLVYVKGNQIFYSVPAVESFHASIMSRHVFSLKPQLAQKGFEWWTLASVHKRYLLEIAKKINSLKGAGIELLSLRQEDPNFFAPGALSELTELQRNALLAAFRSGYYDYPRKADLKKLAKKLGVPRTTLTEHLRKAESKIIPLVLSEYSGTA